MRLRRLELQGFKSFMDRTILTFEPGITGVVGPNGCGKSNIVDAIMWVMGEQSPKHLRGESMTDIIFNGSDTRSPTSMAEVSLIMDRQGVPLAPQFAAFDKNEEISVTRRIYRDGTGEFLINKTPCRLKDIHELFMDTGVGRRAYSIIEQGQIDRMINVKPEDRRYLFEEVAGITKYKAKRKEAERKLELTHQNILRIQDIITELEKQIRSLKIQATRARKYKDLKGEMEVVDLHLLGRNLQKFHAEIEALQTKREELIRERSGGDAQFARVDAEVTELEVLRVDQERDFQELGQRERDIAIAIQKLESQIELFEERRKFLTHSNEQILKEENEIQAREEALVQEREGLQTERIQFETSLQTLEEDFTEQDVQLRISGEQKLKLTQKKQQLQERLNSLGNRSVSLENSCHNGQARLQELSDRRDELAERLTAILSALETHQQALFEIEKRIEDCASRGKQAETEVSQLDTECREISRRLSESEDLLFQSRENFHAKNSRLESLKELQKGLEGYSPTAREILLSLEGRGTTATPLAESIQPEPALEELLELLLGSDMNTLLVSQTAEAEELSRFISEKGLERVRIAALSEMAVVLPDSAIPFPPLLSRVQVKPGFEMAASRWLGKVFLCSSEEELFSARSRFPGTTFLTIGSQIIAHADGSIGCGSQKTSSGIFARRREIEELTELCSSLSQKLNELASERENLLKHLETQEGLHAQMKDRLSSIHIESVEFRNEREKVQIELQRAERDRASLQDETSRNLTQLESIQGQVEQWTEELTRTQAEVEGFQVNLGEAEAAIETSSHQFETLVTSLNELKVQRSTLNEKMNGLQYKLEKISSEEAQLQNRLQSIRHQRSEDERELIKMDSEKQGIAARREEVSQERSVLLVQISDVKAAFTETCETLQRLREEKDELQEKRETVLTEIQDLELKAAEARSRFEQIKNTASERYHREPAPLAENAKIDIEKLPLFVSQLNVTFELQLANEQETLLQEYLKNIKEKVDRYGEVNLTAIQEFEEIQKRFDFLTAQKEDLENSIKILEEAIQKIDESTKTRFEDTFTAVNRKFKEIFPILFNGGKAELALTNPDNLLESGVEVMVQPPGKRLQSITLLSGGEKALTAVSLILAIFARKPSPFCLLDEVDAPLDDANVSRFNTVIRKMAEKTQFIVITHNKKTMEIAEALYGVTMERAGVSKMTSVRMN